jgi:hypothetical protein
MNSHRSRRTILRFFAAAGIFGGMTPFASPADDQCNSQSDHIAWVAKSLEHMLTIKAGMTRNQLMKIFTTEGGISSAKVRTFVSRDCPYFKVDVTFRRAAAGEESGGRDASLRELDNDVITTISRPYLQFSIFD